MGTKLLTVLLGLALTVSCGRIGSNPPGIASGIRDASIKADATLPAKCGGCVVIASGQASPVDLAVDAAHIFWINSGTINWNEAGTQGTSNKDGAVVRALLDGGEITTLVANQPYPGYIGLDDTNVYWTVESEIRSIPKAGGTGSAIATGLTNGWGLAVGLHDIYWAGSIGNDATSGELAKVPKSGGTPIPLATGQARPYSQILSDTNIFWIDQGTSTGGKLNPDGAIMTLSGDAGSPVTLASAQTYPIGLVNDNTNLYWASPRGVMTVPKAGGAVSLLSPGNAFDLAIDDAWLYAVDYTGGTVSKIDKSSGARTLLASDQKNPHFIVADSTYIYWTNFGDGTVMKLAK